MMMMMMLTIDMHDCNAFCGDKFPGYDNTDFAGNCKSFFRDLIDAKLVIPMIFTVMMPMITMTKMMIFVFKDDDDDDYLRVRLLCQ